MTNLDHFSVAQPGNRFKYSIFFWQVKDVLIADQTKTRLMGKIQEKKMIMNMI